MTLMNYSADDLSANLLRDAYSNNSWTPERRADESRRSYVEHMAKLDAEFSALATDDNRADLVAALEAYRVGYLSRYHAMLGARSRTASWAVTGRSGFNFSRNEKRMNTLEKREREFFTWTEESVKRLRRQFRPAAEPTDPASKLEAMLAESKLMKDANKVIRSKQTNEQKVESLVALGLTRGQAIKLLTPDHAGRTGFQSFELTNLSARIRALKAKLEVA